MRVGLPAGCLAAVAAACVMLGAPAAQAQLISPGRLTAVHAELEGIRNCTSCHALGQRGVSAAKCLSCHTPLRDRIRRGEGLHANVVQTCASCHSDHHGRDFDSARFEERRFRHELTGYRLVGEHRTASCRSCHTPERITDPAVRRTKAAAGRLAETYLGLADDCATCHEPESPHSASIGADCASCHAPTGWTDAEPFAHARTGFALVGAHASASCASCHGAPGARRFTDLATDCASCHASDNPHGRSLAGQTCQTCHTAARWSDVGAFDHRRTSFALTGAHLRLDCASCHGAGRDARFDGTAADCASCHAGDSPHAGQFAGRSCGSCHGDAAWDGAVRFQHAATGFALAGAHAEPACASCHATERGVVRFEGVAADCASCHDDAHDGALGADCATCHAPTTWERLAPTFAADRFDHAAQTGFALVGAHARADCASCHTPGAADGIAVTPLETGVTFPALAHDACLSCHRDPHEGAFADNPGGADCAGCHDQEAFRPADFGRARHAAETAFALTGAHLAVPCGACHTARPGAPPAFALAEACEACHADENPHGDAFETAPGVTACAACHTADVWDLAQFDHAATGFALAGAHAAQACAACHAPEAGPDGAPRRTFRGLSAACASCHQTPHQGQFEGRSCDTCHDDRAFTVAAFDHARTAFALTGAHLRTPCAACHGRETSADGTSFVRFTPLPTTCVGCHGPDGSP